MDQKRPDRNLNVHLNGGLSWGRPGYESEFWHMEGDAVRMSVPVNGATTSGSKNPRMELSENPNRWSMVEGDHRMKVTVTIQKVIPNVNFDVGQILRTNKIRMTKGTKIGKKCPLHLQVEYQANSNEIHLKHRLADCRFKRTKIRTKYPVGEEFSYEVAVVDGIMTYTTSKGDKAEMDYNFLSDEYDGRGESGYFKAGVYTQRSCSKAYFKDISKCTYGEGPDDMTVADFKNISLSHENTEDEEDDDNE